MMKRKILSLAIALTFVVPGFASATIEEPVDDGSGSYIKIIEPRIPVVKPT